MSDRKLTLFLLALGLATIPFDAPCQTTGTAAAKSARLAPITWGCEDEWKLQVSGRQRLRVEHRGNFDMDDSTRDDYDPRWLRTQISFDLAWHDCFRVFLQVLDGRIYNSDVELKQDDHYDINQAFVEFCDPAMCGWRIRAGRQELNLGEKRLVESSNWSNLPNTWEGLLMMYSDSCVDLNAFVLQPDTYARMHDGVKLTGKKQRIRRQWFYGVYSTYKGPDSHEADLYWLGLSDRNDNRTFPSSTKREDGTYGTASYQTVGTRCRGPLWTRDGCGALGYGFEAAYQFGNKSDDDVRAWMAHADLNYTWDHPWKPKLVLEGNLASGDRRDGDGETNSFNKLFGSTHTPYGIIDVVRLQNLREIALVGNVRPTSRLKLQMELHQFWLDSRTDSWYFGNGSSYGRDKTGNSGRDVGHELDLIAQYKVSDCLTLEGGGAHFFPGNFARKNGRDGEANFAYFQYVWSF